MEKFDHPLVFIFFSGMVNFAVILLIVYIMSRAGLGNPIDMAAGKAA